MEQIKVDTVSGECPDCGYERMPFASGTCPRCGFRFDRQDMVQSHYISSCVRVSKLSCFWYNFTCRI